MSKYRVNIIWDEEDQIYIARVPELEGVATHGDTMIEAAKHAEEAIDLHLQTLVSLKEPIPTPVAELNLSGKMSLRMGKNLHETAFVAAEIQGKSLNEYICSLIENDEELILIPHNAVLMKKAAAKKSVSASGTKLKKK